MADTRATLTLAANLDPSGVLSAVKAMQGAFSNLKLPNNIGEGLDKSLSKATDLLKKYQSQLAKGINTKTDAKNITKTGTQINEVLDEITHHINELNGQQIFLKTDVSGLNKLKTDIENARTAWKNAIQEFRKGSDIDKVLNGIGEKTTRSNLTQGSISKAQTLFDKGDLEGYRNALDEIYNRVSKLKDTTVSNVVKGLGLDDAGSKADNLALIKKQLESISKIDFSNDANVKAQFDEITNSVNAYEAEVKRAGDAGQQAFNDINASSAVSNTRALVDATDQYTNSVMSAKDQVQDLQRSTQYFFSLRNMINLLKRGIDDAIQSVKELDKAMTDTAVVTDYKVSDLWNMLPQYTQLANQLGATTQGAYETMTLYFQQGLDQQAAFEVGAETMKMARIAGLDYAETTDMMTAALRGFNMELNETSAKRVNDVYSELAAITASDTEELGTAMQRTASIAHSAGASFEGTTAFLAQAIETTREPAENIGTAMKTIVARFQEMKKNPLEISEVDGEEVDYNKIDAALKTIGVDLKDTNGQFRDFDQVMLDISSRWDTLSQSQQRYIATVAAGSRQQSRFIAMVSNYDRTMQLMEAANNSTGASDEQFGKTMDSLESKLNQLHNAWQRFTMGIANNGMIKLAVDGLTGFLNITNDLISALSLGIGPVKSFLSIFAAFTGLKVAGRVANSLIGGLGGLVDPQSTIKEGLKIGLFGQGKTNAQAQAITTPIVGVLNKISGQIAQIKNKGVNNKGQSSSEVKNTSKQEYLDIKKQFNRLSGKEGFTMDEASSLFGKLDAKHQQSMFNNNPGTKLAMKQASLAWFGSRKDLSKAAIQEGQTYISSIYKGMEQGRISVDKGIELIGQPQKWGYYLGTETAMAYSQSFVQKSIPIMKENTAIAHEAAIASLGFNPQDYKVGSKELKDLFKNDKQLATQYASLYSGFRGDLDNTGHGQTRGKVSDIGRFANDIGSVADRFTQAGYGITAFGNALSQLGGPLGTIGSGISAMGGAITTMGMSISGATGIISLFTVGIQDAAGATVIAGSTIAAVAAPLAVLAAGFLLARAHLQKVKEAGEEVTKTFNDTNKEVDGNISKLKSYQSELATLSQGVDSNGNNVSLDDSQYQRYLEIVDDIAKINPEIVQGYNAQGHAIIDNNKALDETLKKQQQIKKEALDTYTKQDSLQKLINARNINKNYKQIQFNKQSGVADGSGHGNEGRPTSIGSAVPLAGDVSSIADKLRLTKGFDSTSLKKFGIESLDDLLEGEEQAVKNFIKHRNQIQAELTNSGIELNKGLIKGFEKLNTDQKAFDEAIQPVYDNLLTSISNSSLYKDLGSEFKEAISLGLKDIASQDLNASEMQSQANLLVQEFENLTREGGEYSKALEQVETAQDKFASSLDVSEYTKNTESALSTLDALLNKYKDDTTAYGQAVREYLENQIEKIKAFPQEGSVSLTEALNGVTNTISAAEGAYSSFQEATKTDLSTGAESMKSIFDEITKETDGVALHMEAFGDQTMWKGARALLGDKFVEENAENVEAIKAEIKSLGPELQQGEKGFAAFWENFKQVDDSLIEGFHWNEDGSYDLDRNINPDAYKEIAEQMHRSEEYVVSMLNKGRQFADIDFTNIEDVRKALSTDNAAIVGTGSTGGNKDLYVKRDYLENAMGEAGIYSPAEQAEEVEKLLAQGVKVIPNAEDMTKKDFKSMGISDIPSLVQKLGDTGQFNRSEVEEYAKALQGDEYNAKELDTAYQDYLDSQDHPELPSITSIDGNVASILGIIASNRVEQGYADQATIDAYEEAKQIVKGENGRGKGEADSISELFALGKNKNGERLSESEYKQTAQSLETAAQKYEQLAQISAKGAEKAYQEGRNADYAELSKEAKGYKTLAEWTRQDLEAGKAVHDNLQKDAESIRQEAPGMTSEANQKVKEQRENTAKAEETAAAESAAREKAQQQSQQNSIDQAEQKAQKKLADAEAREYAFKHQMDATNQAAQVATQEQQQHWKNMTDYYKQQDSTLREQQYFNDLQQERESKENSEKRQNAYNQAVGESTQLAEAKAAVLQAGWGDLLSGVSPDTLVTPEAQSAMQVLAQNAFDPNMVMTPTIESALATLGLTTADAYTAGSQALSDNLATAGQNVATDIEQGEADANQHLEALAMNAMPGFAKIADNVQDKVNNFIDSINGINVPELTPTINQGTELVGGVAEKAVAATLGVDTTEADAKIQETQAKVEETANTVNQGATFRIKVPGVKDLTRAEKAASTLASKAGTQTIGVKTGKVDTGTVKAATSSIKSTQADINVGANTNEAYSRVNQLIGSVRGRSAYIDIEAHVRKTGISSITIDGKTVNVRAAAGGMNNHISSSPLPSFGSAAKGRYGTVGPKDKGGLTLTGERGFEIAWLPSENRSMILGANGPQMLNLPSDAVVYTHEQSKKIIKQKARPAGSMDSGKYTASTSKPTSNRSGNGNRSQNSATTKQNADNAKNAAKVIQKIGYVSVWWENMSRRVDATQKKYDKDAKDLEKRLKAIGTTLNSVKNLTDAYRKNLNLSIALNKQEVKQANFELKELKRGKNWRSKQEISYSIKGDDDKSESKKETVDLGNFITYNSTYGTWEISQKAIDLIAKGGKDSKGRKVAGNKEKAEAIKQSAEKEINDRNSKLKTAEDNIAKAQEALEKLSNDMYETFYRWEKSINKIYLLSQKLETLGKQQTIQTKVAEIEYAKMSIGIQTAAKAQEKVNKALREQNSLLAQEVQGRNQAIVEARQEFDNILDFKTYEDIYKANKNSPTAQSDFEAAKMAFNLLSKAGLDSINTFDYSKALAQLNSQRYSKDTYEAIKQVLDKIFEKQNNLNDSVINAEDTVLKVYQQLEEYQTTIADFEESLLDGMEKEAEKQINRLDKINTTLSKAYKELIDEVKNKLDERRKQEDNQKTESELSQKQQRLSMLRADTSGGHAVEIAQLEKEIADAQQNYQRSLEDQLIEKLQRQGDEAEKQRQKQIDLLNIQNEIAKETGTNLAEVKELLSEPTSNKDAIKKIWLTNQGYDETTTENQKKLENDFEVAWSKYMAAWTQRNELMSNDALIGTFADISKYDDAIYKKLDSGIINVKLTDAQKKQVGWTATDFAKDGKTFNQLLNLGFTQKGAVQGLANAKGLDWVIDNLHATAKALTTDYGFTLAQVQKAYNQSQTSKTNKNYMTDKQTGAVAKLTKNGKNVASTALPASGSLIQARNGSTLYSQELNRTTGEWNKDATQYSIGAINAQQISTFGNLGKQALLNAIQSTAFGGFINKQFKSLVQATKLAGTEVKLANGWTGSIGSDGLIYQNHATGVKKWNPATKAITEDKYNDKKKAAFLAVAKRNSETSREYAQVLMNNKVYTRAQLQKMGVKKFRTGGLADYTGPAWLDGTPSKPELVLNAQDTKNFVALKDVLSKAINSAGSVSNEYGGNATYEININVDHLNNDYDVDKVVERVKKKIVQDSGYRNVTQVRKFR